MPAVDRVFCVVATVTPTSFILLQSAGFTHFRENVGYGRLQPPHPAHSATHFVLDHYPHSGRSRFSKRSSRFPIPMMIVFANALVIHTTAFCGKREGEPARIPP